MIYSFIELYTFINSNSIILNVHRLCKVLLSKSGRSCMSKIIHYGTLNDAMKSSALNPKNIRALAGSDNVSLTNFKK